MCRGAEPGVRARGGIRREVEDRAAGVRDARRAGQPFAVAQQQPHGRAGAAHLRVTHQGADAGRPRHPHVNGQAHAGRALRAPQPVDHGRGAESELGHHEHVEPCPRRAVLLAKQRVQQFVVGDARVTFGISADTDARDAVFGQQIRSENPQGGIERPLRRRDVAANDEKPGRPPPPTSGRRNNRSSETVSAWPAPRHGGTGTMPRSRNSAAAATVPSAVAPGSQGMKTRVPRAREPIDVAVGNLRGRHLDGVVVEQRAERVRRRRARLLPAFLDRVHRQQGHHGAPHRRRRTTSGPSPPEAKTK